MTERNIAAEVLDGLREVREHRAGKRTLKTVRVEPRPLPELTPDVIRNIRDRLDVSRAVFAHMRSASPSARSSAGSRAGRAPPNRPRPSSSWRRSTRTRSTAWRPCNPPVWTGSTSRRDAGGNDDVQTIAFGVQLISLSDSSW